MLSIKVLFILATVLVSLSSVFAVESSSAVQNGEFFAVEGVSRLLAEGGNHTDEEDDHHDDEDDHHDELCHCDPDGSVHCLGEHGEEMEEKCHCEADGEAHCDDDDHHDDHHDDEKFELCHCDGIVPHCLGEGGEELEAMCVCEDGEAHCGEDESAGFSSRVIGSATIAAMATVAIAL